MSAEAFLDGAGSILNRVLETQIDPIKRAGELIADAMAADGMAHFFGAGHSHLPVEEAFPRIGSLSGLHPMTELASSYFTGVVGDSGIRQMRFYQSVEGFGDVILANYDLKPPDCMIVYTATGLTRVSIDVARGAKERGLPTVGVTSLAHANTSGTEHSAGVRLHEVVDVVIDTCTPPGDAIVEIPGLEQKVGAPSTMIAIAITHAMIAEAAKLLTERGKPPLVLESPYWEGEQTEESKQRTAEQLERVMADYKRRAAKI
jgi:uncharacterized phosphosugar-binding protein